MFALLSRADIPLIYIFAKKLSITALFKGCRNKQAALVEFAAQNFLMLEEIAFMGDDINDVEALKVAGLSAAPGDAHPSALAQAKFVAKASGGQGAVRELIDHIMQTGLPSPDSIRK